MRVSIPGANPDEPVSAHVLAAGRSIPGTCEEDQCYRHAASGVAAPADFRCRRQSEFRHGATMCTTACMQVGMAMLCGQLNLGCIDSASEKKAVVDTLNWCMEAASIVHGRVENIINSREQKLKQENAQKYNCMAGSIYQQNTMATSIYQQNTMATSIYQQNRMVSINELVTLLGINLKQLGVCTEELFVCKRGMKTRVRIRSPGSGSSSVLRYEAESCFVSLGHVPVCMELNQKERQQQQKSPSKVCLALFTASCHTVCAACYFQDSGGVSYAFFDPSPGQLQVGLSGAHVMHAVQSALGIPSTVCCRVKDVRKMAEDLQHSSLAPGDSSWKARRKKQGKSGDRRVRWAEQENEDGILVGVSERISASQDWLQVEDDFQCDVTLMYLTDQGMTSGQQ